MKEDLCADIRGVTTKFNRPYVTSFCGSSPFSDVSDNGLLSQWRGYGWDGGYAIIFETDRVMKLLEEELNAFQYQFAYFGDVEYYDRDDHKATHSETLGFESEVQQHIREVLLTNDWESSAFEPLYRPVTALSCLHKHRGFREETEVRI